MQQGDYTSTTLRRESFDQTSNPKKPQKKRHIYTVISNGTEDYSIENHFCELETNYARHIKEIIGGRIDQLTEEDRLDIIWFVSLLYARNLSMVTRLSEMSRDVLSFIGNGFRDYYLQLHGEEHLRPLIQVEPVESTVQQTSMHAMYDTAQTLFNSLTSKGEWVFCISDATSEFITTDNPMSNLAMLPLSKKVLFMRVTEQIEGLRRTMSASPDWVHNMNCTIASSATRYLYGSSKQRIKEEYLACKN